MSYIPGRGEIYREGIGGREVEANLATHEFEHRHPEAEYGLPKRPGMLERLRALLSRKHDSESDAAEHAAAAD